MSGCSMTRWVEAEALCVGLGAHVAHVDCWMTSEGGVSDAVRGSVVRALASAG